MTPAQSDKSSILVDLARGIAAENPDFQAVLGPGAGDHSTHAFMRRLRATAIQVLGVDFSEQKICGQTLLAVDFYFPDEKVIVEVALGLPNPASEFEKDILKAIMAQESGNAVRKLVLISRPGGAKKCAQPGRRAVVGWAQSKHGIKIEVHDLHGEPRKRARRLRRRT
jgi:hypothetical protein